ncbi:hypothetical protein C4556_00385 [Candidatus Parcubacteria bacterium]|nr:MAG: hypothetical protein C4556_00385 [Candidatus Parcubacteria bacterium]
MATTATATVRVDYDGKTYLGRGSGENPYAAIQAAAADIKFPEIPPPDVEPEQRPHLVDGNGSKASRPQHRPRQVVLRRAGEDPERPHELVESRRV